MKNKNIFLFLSMTAIIISSIIIFSCQKDNTKIDKQNNESSMSRYDQQIENKILAFKHKIDLIRENPSLKTGTDPMEIDSAVWYIEATSNLTYSYASSDFEEYIIDSSFIEVPVNNGQILWSEVQIAYDKVIDSLSAHNAAITASEKQLIISDISLKESTDNTVTFEVTSGFGTDGITGIGNDYPWYWGWEIGRCDGTGLGVGYDAAYKIAQLANFTIPVPGGNSYCTDIEYKYVYSDDYLDEYGNPLLFNDFQEYTLNHQCLSTTDIAGYISNLIYIGVQEKPSNKSLINYSLFDMTMFMLCGSSQHDCWIMEHHANTKYGIWHTSNNPPSEL